MTEKQALKSIDEDIDGIGSLSRPDLVGRWRKLHGRPPPKGASRRFLILGIAYQAQVKRFGGLKAGVRRKLTNMSTSASSPTDRARGTSSEIGPGSRLIREWNGRSHTVDVTEQGYLWNGKHYRSLSAAAKAITGARWSGTRFFGLGKTGAS